MGYPELGVSGELTEIGKTKYVFQCLVIDSVVKTKFCM